MEGEEEEECGEEEEEEERWVERVKEGSGGGIQEKMPCAHAKRGSQEREREKFIPNSSKKILLSYLKFWFSHKLAKTTLNQSRFKPL